jgi:hypothetical protein
MKISELMTSSETFVIADTGVVPDALKDIAAKLRVELAKQVQ